MGEIVERCTIGYFQTLSTSNAYKFLPKELLSKILVPTQRLSVGLLKNIYFYRC